jgi:tellurite methyltransferase
MTGANRCEPGRGTPPARNGLQACGTPQGPSATEKRADWESRHRTGAGPGAPEPWVVEMLDEMLELVPRGLALDVAAGSGRHSLVLARAGFEVVAVDYAEAALRTLQSIARGAELPVSPLAADLSTFALPRGRFDAILNVNFLDRALVPRLIDALRPGGALLFDTFLIDQAASGHPRNPDFMLQHYELREMLNGMDLLRYREGIVAYPDGRTAWRASALALRRCTGASRGV